MALSKAKVREILSTAGVDSEHMGAAVDAIIDGNVASVEALREEVAKWKTEAEKLAGVQKELDDLRASTDSEWKQKYDTEHEAFEAFKRQTAEQRAQAEKVELYRELLRSENVADRRIDSILRVTDFSQMVVKDGKLDNADALREGIRTEWADFIMSPKTHGTPVETPPASTPSAFESMSLSEKMMYANEHPTAPEVQEFLKEG